MPSIEGGGKGANESAGNLMDDLKFSDSDMSDDDSMDDKNHSERVYTNIDPQMQERFSLPVEALGVKHKRGTYTENYFHPNTENENSYYNSTSGERVKKEVENQEYGPDYVLKSIASSTKSLPAEARNHNDSIIPRGMNTAMNIRDFDATPITGSELYTKNVSALQQ